MQTSIVIMAHLRSHDDALLVLRLYCSNKSLCVNSRSPVETVFYISHPFAVPVSCSLSQHVMTELTQDRLPEHCYKRLSSTSYSSVLKSTLIIRKAPKTFCYVQC